MAVHLQEDAGALALAAPREGMTGRDREVAQAREHLRGAAVLELAAVFVLGAVAAVVQRVFDAPVRAERGRKGVGVELCDRAAGEYRGKASAAGVVGRSWENPRAHPRVLPRSAALVSSM